MGVEVKCCTYDGDPRVIDKKPTLVKTLVCRITDPSEVVNPSILLTNVKEVERCNYFVIGFRKYFKVGERKTNSRMVRMMLHEDVLSTWMPRVHIIGSISNASKVISDNVQQNYLLDSNKRTVRLRINNSYGEITSNPIIVVQSPQGSVAKPST